MFPIENTVRKMVGDWLPMSRVSQPSNSHPGRSFYQLTLPDERAARTFETES